MVGGAWVSAGAVADRLGQFRALSRWLGARGLSSPSWVRSGRPLLMAAQSSHEVRADLTLKQILDMVVAIAKIRGDPSYLEPILDAAVNGPARAA